MLTANGRGPDFTGRRVRVVDTECTGLDDPEILESCWLELDNGAHVGGFFLMPDPANFDYPGSHAMHKTSRPSTLGALAAHHILDEFIPADAEPFGIERDLGPDPLVLIGHNVDFDWRAMRYSSTDVGALLDTPRICTLAMARRIWPDLDAYSLTALIYHIKGRNMDTRAVLKNAHSAEADVMLCLTLFLALLQERPELKSWKAVWEFSEDARLPRRWTFGKYGPKGSGGKGELLQEAPPKYIQWVRDNCTDRDDWEYLERALDLMQKGLLTP